MTLDADAVLGAAHRHATRRTAGQVVASVAAVGALAAVVVNFPFAGYGTAAPAWRTSGPTATDQVPQAVGEGDLATMADGVRAVNVPGPAQAPASGAHAALPGATAERDLGLTGPDGASVQLLTSDPGPGGSARLRVVYTDGSGTPVGSTAQLPAWSWAGGEDSANDASWARVVPDSSHQLDAALVPADIDNPRAFYWTVDGSSYNWQEVPTFDTGNGRLITVFTTTGTLPHKSGLAFVGTHGAVVEAPCPAVASCTSISAVPGLSDALENYTDHGAARLEIIDQGVEDAERALSQATTKADREAAQTALDEARAARSHVTITTEG